MVHLDVIKMVAIFARVRQKGPGILLTSLWTSTLLLTLSTSLRHCNA